MVKCWGRRADKKAASTLTSQPSLYDEEYTQAYCTDGGFLSFSQKACCTAEASGVLELKAFKNQGFELSPVSADLLTSDVFESFPSTASSLLSVVLLGFASGVASGFVFSDWLSELPAPFGAPALYSGIAKLSHVCPSSIGAMARISVFAFSTSWWSL